MKKNEPTLDDILGLNDEPAKVKPKAKPKKAVAPVKLNSDAKDVHENTFAAAILSGSNNTDAYLVVYPDTTPSYAKQQGNRFRKRAGVIAAIKEGKDNAIHEVMKAAGYGLEEAFKDVCNRIERADAAEQHSAVAQLQKQKLELIKLIGNGRDSEGAGGTTFQMLFSNTDGTIKEVGPHTIDQNKEGKNK